MRQKRHVFYNMLFVLALLTACSPQPVNPTQIPTTGYLPRTHGSIDPNVTQENIQSTICVSGYTSTVRPSSYLTNKWKAEDMVTYGYSGMNMSQFEYDHIINLGIGGCPSCRDNLFPQPYAGQYGARIKDKLEVKLQDMVCDGSMTLKEAQNCIGSNWVECGRRLGVFT